MKAEDWIPISTMPAAESFPILVLSSSDAVWKVNAPFHHLDRSTSITHWIPFVAPVNKEDAAFDEWWKDRFDSEILSKCNARHVWHAALEWKEKQPCPH